MHTIKDDLKIFTYYNKLSSQAERTIHKGIDNNTNVELYNNTSWVRVYKFRSTYLND